MGFSLNEFDSELKRLEVEINRLDFKIRDVEKDVKIEIEKLKSQVHIHETFLNILIGTLRGEQK